MSLRVKIIGEDDNIIQIFSNNYYPNEFKDFLKSQGVTINPDGDFYSNKINTKDFVKWYIGYAEDLYNDLVDSGTPLLPIRKFYNKDDKLDTPLTFLDRLNFAVESSSLLEILFVMKFLKENNIADYDFGNLIVFKDYLEIKGS